MLSDNLYLKNLVGAEKSSGRKLSRMGRWKGRRSQRNSWSGSGSTETLIEEDGQRIALERTANAGRDLVSCLPVLVYDGANMTQIDAGGILDVAMAGTSATLLARKWERAMLFNVDNEEAMAAVGHIEGWRALGDNVIAMDEGDANAWWNLALAQYSLLRMDDTIASLKHRLSIGLRH